jgi:uncharacterized protein YjiS (DUF1127 family)
MSLLTVFIAAASAWADWRRRRRSYGELMALDDRLLADIGLRRTDISGHLPREGAPREC